MVAAMLSSILGSLHTHTDITGALINLWSLNKRVCVCGGGYLYTVCQSFLQIAWTSPPKQLIVL